MTKSHKPLKNPELLAPAGSLEAFFAAMEKGADAVYAGLKEFSARAKAKNFTLYQLERMTAYAHSLDRKVYVTLNTLVKEQELPQLVEVLSALENIRCDAVILQDMAVARIARRHFPSLPLHASTQMTIHNSLGVRQLADLGFERVVLARELHLDEIAEIVRTSPIGIECFIHGALCFSFSGQCYFSSFLGGHSGNRGRCAQPCRRLYHYRGKEGYYFSTNDFSSIELLPQIRAAGIASLKIEGRMKSAEYVACVVEAYRKGLDASPAQWPSALAAAKETLKLSFGRSPTKGFLASHKPVDIAVPSLKGATGRFLGNIRGVRHNVITFETRDTLHLGDRIRIQPKTDMAGKAFTIKELFVGDRPVKGVQARTVVATVSPFPVKVDDAVFKVSSETAFTMSEAACLKRLEGVRGAKIPCSLTCALSDDNVLAVGARAEGEDFSMVFPLGPLEPSRSEDMAGVLAAQFRKTGDTPFTLTSLHAPGFPAVLIPPARLKDVRREFYSRLAAVGLSGLREKRKRAREEALKDLVGKKPRVRGKQETVVRMEHLRDYSVLHDDAVTAISVPVSRANLHQLPAAARKLRGSEDRVLWRLPFIMFETDIPFYREALAAIASYGFRRFEAANLGHFPLLAELATTLQTSVSRGCQGGKEETTPASSKVRRGSSDEANAGSVVKAAPSLQLSTDYRLFSLNSQALLAWQELGVQTATLYLEDDVANFSDLFASDVLIGRQVVVYGGVPAITSKIEIRGVKNDSPLVSDRGDEYQVTCRDGLTTVTPLRRFSLTGEKGRLADTGCSSCVLDFTQLPREEWPQVLDAFSRGKELPGTSTFNFTTGLV